MSASFICAWQLWHVYPRRSWLCNSAVEPLLHLCSTKKEQKCSFKLLSDPWVLWCFYSSQGQHCAIIAGKCTGSYFLFAVGLCMLVCGFPLCMCVCVCHCPSGCCCCGATGRKATSDGWLLDVCLESCLVCLLGIFLPRLAEMIRGLFPGFTKTLLSLSLSASWKKAR